MPGGETNPAPKQPGLRVSLWLLASSQYDVTTDMQLDELNPSRLQTCDKHGDDGFDASNSMLQFGHCMSGGDGTALKQPTFNGLFKLLDTEQNECTTCLQPNEP